MDLKAIRMDEIIKRVRVGGEETRGEERSEEDCTLDHWKVNRLERRE